jgi:predicted nucleic acid-binding protein
MIVVSDTSPLCYLILIDLIEVLPQLYGEVFVPQWVQAELAASKSPTAVQQWIAAPPGWLVVRPITPLTGAAVDNLDRGEREAIALAEMLSADLVMLDDLAARRVAQARNLPVIGLLGVLKSGANRDLLDLRDALKRLQNTSFRVSVSLVNQLLDEVDR